MAPWVWGAYGWNVPSQESDRSETFGGKERVEQAALQHQVGFHFQGGVS